MENVKNVVLREITVAEKPAVNGGCHCICQNPALQTRTHLGGKQSIAVCKVACRSEGMAFDSCD
jgi:hypothetical protein